MNEVIYCKLSLPGKVRGATVKTPDGDYIVIINDNLCDSVQQEAAKHELEHFKLDHFFSERSVGNVEEETKRNCM